MARLKKTIDVQKFGGETPLGSYVEENAKDAPVKDVSYEVSDIETSSKTVLEDDAGHGDAVIVRCFRFGLNPQAFKEYTPTLQEIFNSHIKGIEISLWKDGMKLMTDVAPRITIDEQGMSYQIFVGARPMRGHRLHEKPLTLHEIAHG